MKPRVLLWALLIVGLLLWPTTLFGQRTGAGRRPQLMAFSVGAKAQLGFSDLRLSASAYDIYSHGLQPTGGIGGWVQWRADEGFLLRPELMFRTRGTRLTCEDVHYSLSEQCLSVGLTAGFYVAVARSLVTLYAVATPRLNLPIGGSVSYRDDLNGDLHVALSRSEVRAADADLCLAAGVELPLFLSRTLYLGAEVGYGIGLTDGLRHPSAFGEGEVLNRTLVAANPEGRGLWRGLELSVRVGIPLGSRKLHLRR